MRMYRFTKERLFSGLSSTITNNSEKLNAIQSANLTLKVDDINNKLSTAELNGFSNQVWFIEQVSLP